MKFSIGHNFTGWFSTVVFGHLFFIATTTSPVCAKPQALWNLKRMTVGPFDNLQGEADAEESMLIYTRSQNLSSQIVRVDFQSGKIVEVTEPDADAKNPALSPDKNTIAFTYFKNDAKGDICLIDTDDDSKSVRCISDRSTEDHGVAWVNDQTIVFLSRTQDGNELKLYDLSTKKTVVLSSGSIYAPDVSSNGKTLVFNGKRNELVIFDISAKKVMRTISVDMQGLTGPARFSVDGKTLYFAQYLVDSNRDQRIDAQDRAAIYRLDLDLKNTTPLQMTSLDSNCSYPFPSTRNLYLTCAFEGALDIYQAPLQGTVPTEWVAKDLLEAHEVARSYSDRVLFLNHLKTKFKQMDETTYERRTFENLLYAGEYFAAAQYAGRLSRAQPTAERWALYEIILESYARWEVLPPNQVSAAFSRNLEDSLQKISVFKPSSSKTLALGFMSRFNGDLKKCSSIVQSLEPMDGLDRYWITHLAQACLRNEYGAYLETKILSKLTKKEDQVYYLDEWLSLLPRGVSPEVAVSRLKPRLSAPWNEQLENELDLYKLLQAKDKKEANAAYRPIAARVQKLKADYFLMRAVLSRSVIVLSREGRSRDLADIISLWTSHLKRDGKEYPYAVQALRQTSIDIAYRFMHGKKEEQRFAVGAFFDSIRASDDLEAHYQHALLKLNTWSELTAAYETMVKQGLVSPQSRVYVESIRRSLLNKKKMESSDYADEFEKIEKISDAAIGVAAKYLYLGYLSHMQLDVKGYEHNVEAAQLAHKFYLYALDSSVFNDRLRAAALQNLGVLHYQTKNFSLAANYFSQRQTFDVSSTEQLLALSWVGAKVNYLAGRYKDAHTILKNMFVKVSAPHEAFLEKAAFYAWNAEEYEAAESYFAKLSKKTMNLPAVRLGRGYTLLKLGNIGAAQEQLKAVVAAPASKDLKKDPSLKRKFVALGLLAQTKLLQPKDRIEFLRKRLALFEEVKSNATVMQLGVQALNDQEIKETQDLALLLVSTDKSKSEQVWRQSFPLVKTYGESYGYLNNTVFNALKNASLSGVSAPKDVLSSVDAEFNKLVVRSPVMTKQWAELKLVYSRANSKAAGELFAHAALKELERMNPQASDYLKRYAKALR